MAEFLALEPEAFGLDISDFSLKFIKLKRKKRDFELASFGEFPLKEGIVEKGEIKNMEALVKSIKKGLSKVQGEKIRTSYVVCSLPEEKSFLQVIQMPKLNPEDLKKAVYYEAENYIPLALNEVYLDSQIIPPVYNHLDHTDVLVVALPRKIVDSYVELLKKAKLQPLALEIESLAVSRALIENEVTLSPVIIIDLGAVRTNFIIYSGYSLRFTSSISVSCSDFIGRVAQEMKVDISKAEKLIRKYGLSSKAVQGKKISKILLPVLADFIKQIKKYLDYYHSHAMHEHLPPDKRKTEKLLLCGRGACLKGLSKLLSDELSLPVKEGNPWINISPLMTKNPPLPLQESLKYTTALGLALRGIRKNNL
ncbi:type IV pilus assembly protein PilM [bacterium]|nr:type IV pilus assembly protein PilM [bacterium]